MYYLLYWWFLFYSLHLEAFLISLSNAWGLFVIIFLLGYGLVAVPKELFKMSNYENRLKFLEWSAGESQQELNTKKDEQIVIQKQINNMRNYEFKDLQAKFLVDKLYLEVFNLFNFI